MTKPGHATIAAHTQDLDDLTSATTTTEFGEQLATWRHLSSPGFPNDLPDGRYFDGFFLATKRGDELAVTRIHQLPLGTLDLWQRHDDELRDEHDRDTVLAELDKEKRTRGRQPIGKPFPVRLPDWRRRILATDAAAIGVPDAHLVRWLLAQAYRQLNQDAEAAGVDRIDLIRERMSQP